MEVDKMLFTEKTKVKLGYVGTVEGKGIYDTAKLEPQPFINLYKDKETNSEKEVDLRREFFKVKEDYTSYYFFARTDGVDIFVELPLVTDDEKFRWTRRDWGRVKTLWTQIKNGNLTFSCTYYLETKNVQINIRWNGNSIGNVWVDNATNEDILSEIEKWKLNFVSEVNISIA